MQFLDKDGEPLNAGLVYAYDAGTTTPRDTYTDKAGGTANANPVVLDSAGRAEIWLSGSYKFVITDSAGELIDTEDNISAFGTGGGDADDIITDFTEVVVAAGDSIVFADLSDGGNTKRDTVQGILDLAPNPGDLILIEAQTASTDTSIDFTTGISSTYETYILVINDLVPTSDGALITLRTSTDAGATWDSGASDYSWANVGRVHSGTTVTGANDAADTEINMTGTYASGSTAGEAYNAVIKLHSPAGARNTILTTTCSFLDASGVLNWVKGAGQRLSAADVTGLRIIPSTSTIASGSFRLYGVKKT